MKPPNSLNTDSTSSSSCSSQSRLNLTSVLRMQPFETSKTALISSPTSSSLIALANFSFCEGCNNVNYVTPNSPILAYSSSPQQTTTCFESTRTSTTNHQPPCHICQTNSRHNCFPTPKQPHSSSLRCTTRVCWTKQNPALIRKN